MYIVIQGFVIYIDLLSVLRLITVLQVHHPTRGLKDKHCSLVRYSIYHATALNMYSYSIRQNKLCDDI